MKRLEKAPQETMGLPFWWMTVDAGVGVKWRWEKEAWESAQQVTAPRWLSLRAQPLPKAGPCCADDNDGSPWPGSYLSQNTFKQPCLVLGLGENGSCSYLFRVV